MTIDTRTLVHRWFDEVWNQGREETIDELFGENAIAYGLSEGEADMRGPEAFKGFWRNMRSTFPDGQITVHDTIIDGDKAVVRITFRGTHQGQGGFGVAPTGRPVSIAGIVIVSFQDGRIHEGWNSWDQLGMLQQIGALSAPEQDRFAASA